MTAAQIDQLRDIVDVENIPVLCYNYTMIIIAHLTLKRNRLSENEDILFFGFAPLEKYVLIVNASYIPDVSGR